MTTTHSRLLSRHDIRFLLYEWLDIAALTERPRFSGQSREDYDDVLELAERIAAERFAPHNRASDIAEPRVQAGEMVLLPEVREALDALSKAGLVGATLDEAVGGLQLPQTVSMAAFAWILAANVATANYALLTAAAAGMLVANGSAEQIARWVPPMVEGRFFGTMCLSEPHVGSSLADITTQAEPDGAGVYRLFGTKMWISGGEHALGENIVHLVLARLPGAPPGVKGISLFIVPRVLLRADGALGERNDVVLAGLNHKMGHRGTVNTVLNFGDGEFTPGGRRGAIGYLIGQPHEGLRCMFRMMNEARLVVGLSATALGYTGFLKSLQYARERPQGRLAGQDPSAPPVAIVEHADVRRMLLAQKAYVEGALALLLYCGRLSDEIESGPTAGARERAQLLLDLLTPIAKSWPSQWCLEANSLAMQVQGGYGYSSEGDVEQHYRDNRLNPIHEGTHGIQALDLLGRKVQMQRGAAFALFRETVGSTLAKARAAGPEPAQLADVLDGVLHELTTVTSILTAAPRDVGLANASIYLEVMGDVVVAWMWLEQLVMAAGRAESFYAGKRQAARYFFDYELPRVRPQLELLASLNRTTLDCDPAWL